MNANYQLITVFGDQDQALLGNTAAVVELNAPVSEKIMQIVAADFNQPATAFIWPAFDEFSYHIRWYAPDSEINLCGHGSLAAIASLDKKDQEMELHYKDGKIRGQKFTDHRAYIDVAAIPSEEARDIPEILEKALGIEIKSYHPNGNKHIVLVHNEKTLKEMTPDFTLLKSHPNFGWIVTALGDQCDFVSRTLVPHVQQLEDPATGSSHACLAPFWSKRLNKTGMMAKQLSQRGGQFKCEMMQDDTIVRMTGESIVWGSGTLRFGD